MCLLNTGCLLKRVATKTGFTVSVIIANLFCRDSVDF